MIYGAEEEEEEDVSDIIENIYVEAFDCPSPKTIDIYRVGKKEAGKTRPLRVEFPLPGDVKHALLLANKLKDVYPTVYLGPDRNKEERQAHNELVSPMKDLIKQDPSKHYYIRNNKICHTDKKLSTG